MKVKRGGQEKGFTLVEMLIVLALLGILVAIVVPNVTGFLGRGKSQAYESDRRVVQAAVDAYYTDTKRATKRVYPTANGTGSDAASANVYINMTHLINEGYLNKLPESANGDNCSGCTGFYSWFVDAKGRVTSDSDLGRGYQEGNYP
ncbi:MAG: prepilin-type N-terminal cleavage/methylation domain-containing protein [Chloroflexi bacterium]|nr:prepilin-type N-terminal cleavage/methylation domain-containing protein [Chloroflexota bacterium]